MYKKLAVAYDGSDGSKMAFDKALELKQDFPDLQLSIIYVNEETEEGIGFMSAGDASAPVTSSNVDSTYAQFMPYGIGENGGSRVPRDPMERPSEFSKHMHNSIQQQLDEKNIEANVLALEGNASKTIPAFIDEQKIDLLVVGNSGKSGMQKFFVGSVSKKLLKEASCSVLVVK
ncbi:MULTISPECIES: universal stress protein [Planomicrobium]|uniref:Universal stress protein n=1 Tax=Planomicrobium okeanokoites TaxID=244 RepID=A0ABV7KLZ8_PLAOK|nr:MULTISPECIES: universal stress protein [Planomicrobium]PKH08861.1 universal stress protein [Planomicrobium sp. MB-3u-38]TAA67828.1 universal stress protein [Planomicrobium okeanokoites]